MILEDRHMAIFLMFAVWGLVYYFYKKKTIQIELDSINKKIKL